ncbi:Rid family detoxifying hydrolase [Candidatus Saccharibacteria bacterium]|nr:Rid family detoxifying hydrolase [Candidatus Saccharibacteria bacterium]
MSSKQYGPYRPVVRAGEFYFVSGQVGIDPKTGKASDDVRQQAHQALVNLEAVLNDQGLSRYDIVKTTIYLTDIENFSKINDVYCQMFDDPYSRPARSTVEVSGLPRLTTNKLTVEIEAVAHQPSVDLLQYE